MPQDLSYEAFLRTQQKAPEAKPDLSYDAFIQATSPDFSDVTSGRSTSQPVGRVIVGKVTSVLGKRGRTVVPRSTMSDLATGKAGLAPAIQARLELARDPEGFENILPEINKKAAPGLASSLANMALANVISPVSSRAAEGATETILDRYAEGGGDPGAHATAFGLAGAGGDVAGQAALFAPYGRLGGTVAERMAQAFAKEAIAPSVKEGASLAMREAMRANEVFPSRTAKLVERLRGYAPAADRTAERAAKEGLKIGTKSTLAGDAGDLAFGPEDGRPGLVPFLERSAERFGTGLAGGAALGGVFGAIGEGLGLRAGQRIVRDRLGLRVVEDGPTFRDILASEKLGRAEWGEVVPTEGAPVPDGMAPTGPTARLVARTQARRAETPSAPPPPPPAPPATTTAQALELDAYQRAQEADRIAAANNPERAAIEAENRRVAAEAGQESVRAPEAGRKPPLRFGQVVRLMDEGRTLAEAQEAFPGQIDEGMWNRAAASIRPAGEPATPSARRSGAVPRAEYVPEAEATTPEAIEVRSTAQALKKGDPEAIARASSEMATRIPDGAVLVPLPDSRGSVAANTALARAIIERHGGAVELADVLERTGAVESSFERRRAGQPGLTAEAQAASMRAKGSVPEGRPVIFIDNVETTGATASGARLALGVPDAKLETYAKAYIPKSETKAAIPDTKASVPETVAANDETIDAARETASAALYELEVLRERTDRQGITQADEAEARAIQARYDAALRTLPPAEAKRLHKELMFEEPDEEPDLSFERYQEETGAIGAPSTRPLEGGEGGTLGSATPVLPQRGGASASRAERMAQKKSSLADMTDEEFEAIYGPPSEKAPVIDEPMKRGELAKSARSPAGKLRPLHRVSDEGLFTELHELQGRIEAAVGRTIYRNVKIEGTTQAEIYVPMATRRGGERVSMQSKAFKNLKDMEGLWEKVIAELKKRGMSEDAILDRTMQLINAQIEQEAKRRGLREGVAGVYEAHGGRKKALEAVQFVLDFSGDMATTGAPVEKFGTDRLTNMRIARKAAGAWVDIRGQVLNGPDDFQRLLSPFRSPKMEKFGVIVVGQGGKIVSHTLETSGALNYVAFGKDNAAVEKWMDKIAERAKRAGGQYVFLHHNHPSGDPTPSPDDRMITQAMARHLREKHGIYLAGHYVINHTKGILMHPTDPRDPLGWVGMNFASGNLPADLIETDWTAGSMKIGSPVDAMQYIVQQTNVGKAGHFGVVYLNAQHRAVAYEPHRPSAAANIDKWLKNRMSAHGAATTIIAADEYLADQITKVYAGSDLPFHAITDIIADAVDLQGRNRMPRSYAESGKLTPPPHPGPYADDDVKISRRLFERPRSEYKPETAPFPAYSPLRNAIEQAPFAKGTAQQWRAAVSKGVSKNERDYVGLEGFLAEREAAGAKSIARDEVLGFVDRNRLSLGNVILAQTDRKPYDDAVAADEEAGRAWQLAARTWGVSQLAAMNANSALRWDFNVPIEQILREYEIEPTPPIVAAAEKRREAGLAWRAMADKVAPSAKYPAIGENKPPAYGATEPLPKKPEPGESWEDFHARRLAARKERTARILKVLENAQAEKRPVAFSKSQMGREEDFITVTPSTSQKGEWQVTRFSIHEHPDRPQMPPMAVGHENYYTLEEAADYVAGLGYAPTSTVFERPPAYRVSAPIPPAYGADFDAVEAGIDFTGDIARAAKRGASLSTRIQKFADALANQNGPIERLGELADTRPHENPGDLLTYTKTSDETYRRALNDGVLDPVTREVVAPSFHSIFEPVRGDDRMTRAAMAYVVSKRIVGRGLDAVRGDKKLFAHHERVTDWGDRDPQLREVAKRWGQFVDGIGNYAVKSGLWTQDLWDRMKASDVLYVRFKRIMDEGVKQGGRGPIGQKRYGNIGPGVDRFEGSRRAVSNPAEAMAEYAKQVIHRSDRYRVGAAVFDAIDELGDVGQLIGARLPSDSPAARALMTHTVRTSPLGPPEVIEEVTRLFDPKLSRLNPVLWRNDPDTGRKEFMQIHAPELWSALMQLNAVEEGAVRRFLDVTLRPLKRIFTSTTTAWSPRFSLATNPARDIPDALTKTRAGLTPADIAKGFASAIANLAKRSDIADEAARSGLTGVSIFAQDRPPSAARHAAPFRTSDRVKNRVEKVAGAPVRALEAAGEVSDLGPRLGEYRAALRKFAHKVATGEWTIEEARLRAASLGRMVTLDFSNRPGNPVLKLFADYIPFFGVGLQGPVRYAQAWARNPKRTAIASAMAAIAATVAWTLKQQLSDDDRELIDDRSSTERSGYLFVPAGGVILKVPLGQEQGIIVNGVIAALDKLANSDPRAWALMKATLARALPAGMDAMAQGVVPIPGVQQVQENIANRKVFQGRPVEPRRMENDLPEDRRFDTTAPTFDMIAAGARKVGFGPMDSPLKAENVVRGVASQATSFVSAALDPLAKRVTGRGAEKRVPRGALTHPLNPASALVAAVPPSGTKSEELYYDAKEKFTQVQSRKRDVVAEKDRTRARELQKEYGPYLKPEVKALFSEVDKRLKEIRDRQSEVRHRLQTGEITSAGAKREMDKIVTVRQKLLRRAVRVLRRQGVAE